MSTDFLISLNPARILLVYKMTAGRTVQASPEGTAMLTPFPDSTPQMYHTIAAVKPRTHQTTFRSMYCGRVSVDPMYRKGMDRRKVIPLLSPKNVPLFVVGQISDLRESADSQASCGHTSASIRTVSYTHLTLPTKRIV